jgi:hypothetical protein
MVSSSSNLAAISEGFSNLFPISMVVNTPLNIQFNKRESPMDPPLVNINPYQLFIFSDKNNKMF